MASRKLILLLVENGCQEHVSNDELCKAAKEYTSPTKKKSKKKSSSDVDTETSALYTDNMIVITRKDIELNARADDFEVKACLEDYHIDSLNDYIQDQLDDDGIHKEEAEPVYVLLHQMCDHVEDIKKLRQKSFEIRSFIYITNNEDDQTPQTKTKNETDQEQTIENEEPKEDEKEVEEAKKISISEKISNHLMNETNYDADACLDHVLLYKLDAWKMVTKKNGTHEIRYKCVQDIDHELRTYIHQMDKEWAVYDTNWRKEGNATKEQVMEIPQNAVKDMNEYTIYNQHMNDIQSPGVSSVVQAMIQQIAQDDQDTTTEPKDVIMDEEDEQAGVYRYGDHMSQNHYLNKTPNTQIEANKRIFSTFATHVLDTLFAANPAIDRSVFDAQTTARYTFSALNPSTFDDALIYNELNQLLSTAMNDRIFREDLSHSQLTQRLAPLLSNPYLKYNAQYLDWCDAMLLSYGIDPSKSRHKQRNVCVFLSSYMGFRKWLTLPQYLKDITPNAFYSPVPSSSFLYNNTIAIYPPSYKHWFMGLSAFDAEPNDMNRKPYLWLRDDGNSVISISDSLSVHFADNAQLSFQSKTVIKAPQTETNAQEEDVEKDDEPAVATQSHEEDTIYISLPNEITIEYHIPSGQLMMYYQNALARYQIQQQNTSSTDETTTDPSSNDEDTTDKEDTKPDETEEEADATEELQSVDVSWNKEEAVFVVWRVIDPNGVMTILYSDASERKVFPNSETWYRSSVNHPWIIVQSNGTCLEGPHTRKDIHIATTTDSDTNTKIVTRQDNVLVFCHSNGDGFVQCPDSMHIFVQSNISQNEWNLHELSQWMQNMGVEAESAVQISNVSQNTVDESAEKLKNDLIQMRFELKNDCKMPTVVVDKENRNTKVLFYHGFDATFAHPNESQDAVSTVNHIETGTFTIYNKNEIHFMPKSENKSSSDFYKIDLNDTNPSISIQDYAMAMNGEYKTPDSDTGNTADSRLFVVFRDGNGYELLSSETVSEFRDYLTKYEPKTQILEPKALLSAKDDSPISHRFIMERYALNAPRTALDIPSVLRDTLRTKLKQYQDDEVDRSCHIYRHLLQTPVITPQDIDTAAHDLSTFNEWFKSDENREKLTNNAELSQMNDQMTKQRNKLKAESDLNPLELKLTLAAEIEREKLNALNQELQSNDDESQSADTGQSETEQKNKKESETKARQIRKVQQLNEERVSTDLDKENVSYFENEPFLRDYQINQHLLEIFSDFICVWSDKKRFTKNTEASFISVLSLLKRLCERLRDIISVKTLDVNLKMLSMEEQMMMEIANNERIADRVDGLLCCVGFAVSAEEQVYIPQQSNIFIDAGVCAILSKLDEYHTKFKRFLFKMNNNNTDIVRTFEMDLKSKIITPQSTSHAHPPSTEHTQQMRQYVFQNEDVMDTHSLATERECYAEREYANTNDKPDFNRCVSRCSCCPLDSPQRATKMDVLGRSRKNVIKMDDLEHYPAAVSNEHLNTRYINTEGAVQRRVRTVSTFTQSMSSEDAFPTVVVQPNIIDFGTVSMGYVYRFTASITNHGNSQARIKVDIAPVEYSSVHIKPYYRSGGIAPGITIMLELELYSTDFIGQYSSQMTIKTQKHIFDVDIKADVVEYGRDGALDASQYLKNNNNRNKKSRVTCLGQKK
eukprot:231002_1